MRCRRRSHDNEQHNTDYPRSYCFTFSSRENAYKDSKVSRAITLDEAIQYLKEAEDAGLIHTTMNVAENQKYICNCCSCCCGILNGLTKYNQPSHNDQLQNCHTSGASKER